MERIQNDSEIQQENVPSRDLELVLAEIEKIISTSKEEIREFIQKRIDSLEAGADKKTEISIIFNPLHKGFLSKETGIRRFFMVDPMYLNDNSLYEDFLDTLKQFRQLDQFKSNTLRQLLFLAIQYTLQKYFGNMFANANTEEMNRQFYLDASVVSDEPGEPISIKDFKQKNMAVCAEKATATQNILSFVGMDSYILLSGKCNLSGEDSPEAHTFNVVQTEKGYALFDPTNPVQVKNKEGELIAANPALYPINQEDFEKLLSKQQIILEHKDIQVDENNNRANVTSQRTYGGVNK